MKSVFSEGLLNGERILITGGGTGLGRSMALAFSRLGADLVLCGRRIDPLEQTASDIRNEHLVDVQVIAVDIRDAAAVEAAVESAFLDRPVTGLVNNAAGNFVSRTEDLSSRAFDAIAQTVLHGTFYVTHAVGRRWIRLGIPGSVLSIVVTWVRNGAAFVLPSAMSKAGVDVMTKSLAVEWARYGIRLNAIAPGIIPTEGMTKRLFPGQELNEQAGKNPTGRLGTFEELQNLATFLISRSCLWLNGETIAMDGANALASGGGFYELARLSERDWSEMRAAIIGQNQADRVARVQTKL